jgi:hypothetical protein
VNSLAEQHSRHQEVRSRLWGSIRPPRPVIELPPPDPVVGERMKALFAGADEEAVEKTHYAPFNFLKRPGPQAIVKLVALKHGVSSREILGHQRYLRIVAARHESMWLIHTHCPWLSIPEIGRVFGRDHTTVLHALSKYTGRRERVHA